MARRITPVHSGQEIRLLDPSSQTGLLSRVLRRGPSPGSASLQVGKAVLVVEARPTFRGKLEIPFGSVLRAVVDDGSGWAYTTAVCRFPVYDTRADGSGTGALVGPLWSSSPGLMPDACPVLALDPVPAQAPNIALIFDPCIQAALPPDQHPANPREADSIAAMLLCAEDPEMAREVLGARFDVGALGLGELEYLNRPTRQSLDASGGEASAASA